MWKMAMKEILNTTEHRPWAIPSGRWKFYQEWNDVVFLHWQVELHELQPFVPKELEIDLFEGKPWVSLVAFTMEKVRPRCAPAVRVLSTFDEVNIRTYVRWNNKVGVYFLSIEGGKRLSCAIAKRVSGLPYRFSRMQRTAHRYSSANAEFDDTIEIEYGIAGRLREKTALDTWLTERYALFQERRSAVLSFEIHHAEWSLREIEVHRGDIWYKRFEQLLHGAPNKVHYSEGVRVVAWGKEKQPRWRV